MRRRNLALAGLLATTGLANAALAYSLPSVPSQRNRVDQNGVDLISGQVLIAQTELQIGPSGPGGLTLQQYYHGVVRGIDSSIGGMPTNWHLALYLDSNVYRASIGLTSDAFSRSGNTFTSLSGDGATLTVSGSTYTYTTADGIQIIYSYTTTETDESDVVARATKVIYPTGDQVSLAWNTEDFCTNNMDGCSGGTYITRVRLQSVTSSSGYQLHYGYVSNQTAGGGPAAGANWVAMNAVSAINLGLDYCDPAAYTCTVSSQTPPSVSYATGSGGVGTTVVTDALGRVTKYNSSAGLFQVQRPTASSFDVVYTLTTDGTAQVTQVVRDGMTYTYAPSLSGTVRTISVTDSLGHSTTTTADTSAIQITSFADHPASGVTRTTTYGIDSYGRITKVTSPEGNYVQYTYDGRGNMTQTLFVPKSGSGLSNITTSAAFPTSCASQLTCNEPTSTTDADSHVTNYTYDPNSGQVATVTSPAVGGISPQTRYTYTALQAYYKNSAGSIVASGVPIYKLTSTSACRTTASCVGTSDEQKTTITYGSMGVANNLLPTQVARGAGDGSLTATSSVSYDAVGNLFTSTNPLGNVTRYRYDADRELVGVVTADPDGASPLHNRARRITYNADGLATLVEAGSVNSQSDADWANFLNLNQVATSYDSADRKIEDRAQEATAVMSVTQYSYDAAGRLDCIVARMNPGAFPAAGSLSACTQGTAGTYGPDRISENHYDAANQVTSVTSGVGTALLRTESSYGYNPNGTMASLTDAKGNVTSYGYDGFDRLTTTNYPKPGGGDFEQLGYDPNGNVTSRRLRDGNSIGYGYDALNRRTSMALPATGQVSDSNVTYSYDLLGHLLQANDTNGHFAHYTYDALGRQITEASPWGTKTSAWNLNGDRTRLTWPDGFFVNYFYNALDEMVGIQENGSTFVAAFDYDDLGRRIKRHLNGDAVDTTYSYVGMSRLGTLNLLGTGNPMTITLGNYSPAGEIGSRSNSNDAFAWTQGVNVNRAYTSNSLNQYASVAGSSLSYDAKGNLTSSGGTSYVYNSKNQLASSGSNGYYYDPLGRLDQSWGEGLSFDYDGQDMISEVNSSNQIVRRYIFGPGGDEPIIWYEGSGTTDKRFLDQDERGSIVRITKSDGTTLAINSYDEYGIPASTNQGRFQYTGQAWLPTLGMYYYKARVYSPTLGRFMQTDPIGYSDGPNWYNYVGSDPINLIDPMGLECAPAPNDGAINVCGSKGPVGTGSVGHSDPSSAGDPKTRQPKEPQTQKTPPPPPPSRLHKLLCGSLTNAVAGAVAGTLTNPAVNTASRLIRGSIAVSRAVEGAEIGGEVGAFGGPVGIAVGVTVAVSTSLAIGYAQDSFCGQ
jgi:RHS repeat-associated protein